MASDGATNGAARAAARRLRRLGLDRQGLLTHAPFGRGLAGTRRAIETLGYVQIDTISVVSRAHDHVLQSRVPGYRPELLDRLQADGSVFEYWAHAAAYLPLRDYRYARPHMNAMRARQGRWIRSHDNRLMARVLDRVRLDGPLQARDFEAERRHSAGWWDWKPAKQALEQLFMQGDLMIVRRDGFQKIYDLTERVLPGWVNTSEPTLDEYAAHLVERRLAAHGMACARTCTYQRRTPGLLDAVRRHLDAAERAGALVRTALPATGGRAEPMFLAPAALDGRAPSARARARLLSPFDNALIQRQAASRLFDFDYQLECYRPESKRRFGYFCLPLMFGDQFVGRADCKAHRATGRLAVKRLFLEHPRRLPRDRVAACRAVALAAAQLAAHNACQSVEVGAVEPADWQTDMIQAAAWAAPEAAP